MAWTIAAGGPFRAGLRLVVLSAFFASVEPAAAQEVIPQPARVAPTAGALAVPARITIAACDPELAALIPGFTRSARRFFGLAVEEGAERAFVELRRVEGIAGPEAYRIVIGDDRVVVEAGSPAGAFYGLQTILQLLAAPSGEVRSGVIEDAPRFAWRGVMLDEARHFFGPDAVRSILDMMALLKLNRFHWHLTDTSGWRIEIAKYPRLTEIGAVGNESNPKAAARFYTQQEIRDIVEYARERFIEVVPEVDMPGHAAAAVRAYPGLSGGAGGFTFNPGKEETYVFLTGVLTEVAALFPSPYLHIGGDEVRLGNQEWGELPEVRTMMEDRALEDLAAVEHFFLRRMAGVVRELGKTIVVWDEALAAALPPEETVVMWWRHNRPAVLEEALAGGYRVVMTPRIPMYLDFVQYESHTHGRKWDRDFVPIESVYRFPSPELTGGVPGDAPLIEGIQANLWTDRTHTRERLEFMLYPRMIALAEAAWTPEGSKEWMRFEKALQPMLERLESLGIRYATGESDEVPGP